MSENASPEKPASAAAPATGAAPADAKADPKAAGKDGKRADEGSKDEKPAKPAKKAGPARQAAGDLVESLSSDDKPTRRAGFLFFATIAATVCVAVLGARWLGGGGSSDPGHPVPHHGDLSEEMGDNIGEFMEKHATEARWKNTMLGLGDFTVDLKRKGDEPTQNGVLNMAIMELYAECDSTETCDLIQESSVQARSQVTQALIQIDRDDLLSREGKRKIKKAIIDRLNSWLPRGKIENIFISKMVIS